MPEKRFTPPPKPETADAFLNMHSMNYHNSVEGYKDTTCHGNLRRFFH